MGCSVSRPSTVPTENASAYPPSVQPGIPRLGNTPEGWSRLPLRKLLHKVERPAILSDTESYQLITAKRSRGGIVAREILRGNQIRTKTQFYVETGDFLISNRQISHGACGVVPASLNRSIVSNEYTAFHTSDALDPRFLNALSHSVYFQQTCFHSSIGVHVEKLVFRLHEWMRWEFDIPPIPQQRRIVAVLDAWDDAIDKTEQLVVAKMRRYRGLLARYAAAFHNERLELGELADLVSDRIQPGGIKPDRSIELENIESETGRILGSEKVDGDSALRSRFAVGDTLFGKLRPYLRKFARPDFDGMCSTEIWVLRARSEKLDPALLFYLVQTPEFNASATKQSGSRMPRADWDLVSATPVPCPRDLNCQSKFAGQLSTALDATQPELVKLDGLRAQKRGLMQKLLTGEWQLNECFDAFVSMTTGRSDDAALPLITERLTAH